MKTLVFSDIHHRHKTVQRIIDSVEHDNVILLGDYFDAFNDTVEEAAETATWLKEHVLHNSKIVALIGNHDASYIWKDNHYLRCSGYSDEKSAAINNILNDSDMSKFKPYHIEHNHVFSHAGLSNAWWKVFSEKSTQNENESKLQYFDRVMKYYVNIDIEKAKNNNDAPLFNAGWDRGGIQRDGGINWVDWENFAPINGVNQILGHTTHSCPQICIQKVGGGLKKKDITEYYIDELDKNENYLSTSYDLDTGLRHYMILENNNVDIFHIQTNTNLKEVRNIYLPENPMSGF